MIFRIPSGRHRALPLRFGFWWRRNSFSWVVKFTESCRYDMGNDDQFDTNKLVGIGYLPGHHIDSARFGWRYDIAKGQIEIMAYCYVNGDRIIDHLADAIIGQSYTIKIEVMETGGYWFSVKGPGYSSEKLYRHNHHKKFKYRLGVYFGGNQVAPHEMKIELERG